MCNLHRCHLATPRLLLRRQDALASRLGGVYMVPTGRVVDTLLAIASQPSLFLLTDAQVERWHTFQYRLLSWNGTMRALEEILEGPYT